MVCLESSCSQPSPSSCGFVSSELTQSNLHFERSFRFFFGRKKGESMEAMLSVRMSFLKVWSLAASLTVPHEWQSRYRNGQEARRSSEKIWHCFRTQVHDHFPSNPFFLKVTKVWVHNGLEIQHKMERKKKEKWKTTSPSAWEPLGRRWVSSSGLVFSDQGFNRDGACRDQEKWMDWVKIWRVDLF